MKVLFDITRLVWRARRVAPSGIDRVVAAYAEWLSRAPGIEVAPVSLVGGRLSPVSRERFLALAEEARSTASHREDDGTWARLTARLADPDNTHAGLRRPGPSLDRNAIAWAWNELGAHWRGGLFKPAPRGEVYLNVAHAGLETPGFLAGLKADGVAVAVMIHDLIPLTHPEFCTPASRAQHRGRIDAVLANAALVIANSKATAAALAADADRRGAPSPRTVVAPLGLEEDFLNPPGERVSSSAPYFVCVGTIEARKNLPFLLAVWRRLAERATDQPPPRLVLVGPRGWENEAVLDYLDRCEPIGPLVHEVAGLSDRRLAALMAGASALLAPSSAEGFDLPLMEALALGAPAIASDIPVHRELARGARLIDPLDGPAWAEAIIAAAKAPPGLRPACGTRWADHFSVVAPALGDIDGPRR